MAIASGAAFSVRPSPAAARPCVAASASAAGAARFRGDGSGGGGGGGGGKWWAPLLGWSGQPDYIDAQPAPREEARPNPMAAAEQRGGGKRFGVLTEEKARQLRARMMETESFHDCMYHSAIASRLASAAPADDGKH